MPRVLSVSAAAGHHFSKSPASEIDLVEGLGVSGDAHSGVTVKHRSRVARDPTQPNLRQVHLIPAELFAWTAGQGHPVRPGEMGENILTEGIDLLALPTGAELVIGETARIRITGLRNPCAQIEAFQAGLLALMVEKLPDGSLLRRAGVMAVVLAGGKVRPGDAIQVRLPAEPHVPLAPV